MPRREPSRRPLRRGTPPNVPPELRHANELMEAGQHAQAAVAFEKIARRNAARNGARAPMLFLRAGRAYLLAGDKINGMSHLKQGLSMIATRGDWMPLHRLGQRSVNELNELGYRSEAQEIADYLAATIPVSSETAPQTQTHANLPSNCSGCGATVDAEDVECAYCGSPIQGDD